MIQSSCTFKYEIIKPKINVSENKTVIQNKTIKKPVAPPKPLKPKPKKENINIIPIIIIILLIIIAVTIYIKKRKNEIKSDMMW